MNGPLILVFLFWFLTTYLTFLDKSHLFLKPYVLHERADIAFYVEHPVYIILKM